MKVKRFVIEFVTAFAVVFVVTFVVNAIVVYLWNVVRHDEGAFNWGTTFVLAITCGIALALVKSWRDEKIGA